jgi:hypothetical protein
MRIAPRLRIANEKGFMVNVLWGHTTTEVACKEGCRFCQMTSPTTDGPSACGMADAGESRA